MFGAAMQQEETKEETKEDAKNLAEHTPKTNPSKDEVLRKPIHKYYTPTQLPLKVGLRLSVTEITHIDTTKQQYGIKGYLVYNWRATDKDVENFMKCKENGNKYIPEFTPNLHFVNDVEVKNYEEKNNVKIKYNHNIAYNSQEALSINIVFTQAFDVHNFPFDVQDLRIILTTLFHDPIQEILLVPSLIHNNQFKIDKTWVKHCSLGYKTYRCCKSNH